MVNQEHAEDKAKDLANPVRSGFTSILQGIIHTLWKTLLAFVLLAFSVYLIADAIMKAFETPWEFELATGIFLILCSALYLSKNKWNPKR